MCMRCHARYTTGLVVLGIPPVLQEVNMGQQPKLITMYFKPRTKFEINLSEESQDKKLNGQNDRQMEKLTYKVFKQTSDTCRMMALTCFFLDL